MDPYERIRLLIGNDMVEVLQNKIVLILGLGGVGGYAVEALARFGLKHLILVDYDTIDITNLNRQIIATYDTIGMKKVDAAEERIKLLSKQTSVTKIDTKITEENIDILFKQKIDYIIDACDTVPVKKELIRRTIEKEIRMISSMGTGNKLDPSQLKIMDIRRTTYDPLAKIIRKMVNDEKIKQKIMVISSTEAPIKTKTNVIASNSFVPSTAGLLAASYIVNDVIKDENTKKNSL